MKKEDRSRKEAYLIIKDLGFEKDIKEVFGKDYTKVSNENLWKFIDANTEIVEDEEEEPNNLEVTNHIYDLIKSLATSGVLNSADLMIIAEDVEELSYRV